MDRRRMMAKQSRLPSAYQEVEWIESHGEEFIYTNVAPRGDLFWEVTCAISEEHTGDDFSVFDAYGQQNGLRRASYYYFKTYNWSPSDGFSIGGENVKEFHTRKIENGNKYVDDNLIGTYTISEFTNQFNSCEVLFARAKHPYRSGAEKFAFIKAKDFRFYNANGDIAHFIPCYRKSDNEIGMYDLIGKQFHANAGTGTFTKGPDVN